MAPPPAISRRELNRALLARQHLITRSDGSIRSELTHLIGLQAQSPRPPYIGLWNRLISFDPDDLSGLIVDRSVARIALMRSTIHLVTAEDAVGLRPVLQPVQERAYRGTFAKVLAGHDPVAIAARGRELCRERPRTYAELAALLQPEFPGAHPQAITNAVRTWVPLVGIPPKGLWGRTGPAAHVPAADWFGQPERTAGDPLTLALRYLAAFGPASAADLANWSGLSGTPALLADLRGQLVAFTDETGRELLDIPEAPRPPADTPAPVRLLAEWDNVLLGHADRSRIIDDVHKPAVYTVNGVMPGTVLVDGFVRATYQLKLAAKIATVTVTPLAPLTARQRREIQREADALLGWSAPAAGGSVVIGDHG